MHSALTLLTDDLAGGKLAGETLIISSPFDLTTFTSELQPWQAPKWWKKKNMLGTWGQFLHLCAFSRKRRMKTDPNKAGHASSPSSLDCSEWKHNDVASLTTLIVFQRDTLTPGINCLPENGAKDLKCARAQTPLDLLTSTNQDICQTTGRPKLPTYRTAVTKSEGWDLSVQDLKWWLILDLLGHLAFEETNREFTQDFNLR